MVRKKQQDISSLCRLDELLFRNGVSLLVEWFEVGLQTKLGLLLVLLDDFL